MISVALNRGYKKPRILVSGLSLLLLFISCLPVRGFLLSTRSLEKNQKVHSSFEVVSSEFLTEHNAACTTYRNKKNGAEVLYVNWDAASDESDTGENATSVDVDNESVFGIFFRTPPSDSTGVPHVLEHSVLDGSRKYTTKAPFSDLRKSSLKSFLNAFTYPDRTGYAFASTNTKDYYNIMNVYLDAVFYPRAVKDPFVLAQEGWRLEPLDSDSIDNNTSAKDVDLVYNGVVYSEMRGVYSNPNRVMYNHVQTELFPDNCYKYVSVGDPAIIPELTFENMVNFHEKFYHPTNSKIFVSGAEDINEVLTIVDGYIQDFSKDMEKKENSVITWQKKNFVEPKKVSYPYPAIDESQGNTVVVAWLLNDEPMSTTEELALLVLNHLLVMKLQQTLIESDLGTSIAAGGINTNIVQFQFVYGLNGVSSSNVDELEQLILDTLNQVEGFSCKDITATINTIEFKLREFHTSSKPKGITFMFRVMSKWNYDYDSTDGVKFEDSLSELKAAISESGSALFQSMIQEMFLNNNHRITLDLYPSTTLEAEQTMEEAKRIEAIKANLSEDEVQSMIDFSTELKVLQSTPDSPESVATIPTITIEDVNPNTTEYPISVEQDKYGLGVTMVKHELQSTSGITYIDVGLDVSGLSLTDAPMLAFLFTSMMTRTGTSNYTDVALSQQIGIHTGGLEVSTLVSPVIGEGEESNVVKDSSKFITKIFVRGKSLGEKSDELLSLMYEIITDANLDSQSKAVEILKSSCSSLERNIPGRGNVYAVHRIRARYSVSGYMNEILNGVSSLTHCNQLLDEAQNDWSSMNSQLESIRSKILSAGRSGMIINLTGDSKVLEVVDPNVQSFIERFPANDKGVELQNFYTTEHPWVAEARERMNTDFPIENEALIVSTQVSYVGQGGMIYDFGEVVHGSADVVRNNLNTGFLWTEVRVLLGAYGAYNTIKASEGFHAFVSYRDPNFLETLGVYDNAPDALLAQAASFRDDSKPLELSIISTIGRLDGSPLPPRHKGWTSLIRWLTGESATARQTWRDEVLSTTPEDFEEFAGRLNNTKLESIAVVCSKAAYEEAMTSAAANQTSKEIKMVIVK